ncbi:SET domain-containing protein [Sarocladium strictum]
MASAGPALEKRPHPTKGHALYALRPFPAGSPIQHFTPTILLPQSSHVETLCANCLRQPPDGTAPRACTRCRSAFYCGAECQTVHWKAVHAKECKLLAKVREREGEDMMLPTLVRAALQAAVKDDIGTALQGLEGHTEKWTRSERWEGRGMKVATLALVLYSGRKDLTPEMAARIITQIQTNAFHRYDPDLGQFGIFFEPTLAMANHSCIPNAFVQFVGRDAILRAEMPIAAGDEVEISVRQKQLEDYFFECKCKRCVDDLSVYQVCALSPNLHLNKESLLPGLVDIKQDPVVTARPETKQKIRKFLSNPEPSASQLHEMKAEGLWALPGVAESINAEIVARIEETNISEALALACLQATRSDPYRYPAPFHPVRVKNLLVIAKLISNTAAMSAGVYDSLQSLESHGSSLQKKVQDGLGDIDQVSLCQMILILILRWAPKGYETAWDVCAMAKTLLDDIDKLPGREKELSLINAWKADPTSDRSQAFFDFAVVKPVKAMAETAKSSMDLGRTPDPS